MNISERSTRELKTNKQTNKQTNKKLGSFLGFNWIELEFILGRFHFPSLLGRFATFFGGNNQHQPDCSRPIISILFFFHFFFTVGFKRWVTTSARERVSSVLIRIQRFERHSEDLNRSVADDFSFLFSFFLFLFFVVDYFSHWPRSARRLPSSLVVVCFVQLDCCPPIKSAAVSQPSSAELTRFLPVFTGFYRVLPSFVRHYRHEPVLCGFLWALRGFPSFYRVFIPFWCVLLGFKKFL